MKSLSCFLLFSLSFFLTRCTQDVPPDACDCPIKEVATQVKIRDSTATSHFTTAHLAAEIRTLIKTIDAGGSAQLGYADSREKVHTVYSEITHKYGDGVVEKANLYRTIACAYHTIVCEDGSLTPAEKRKLKTEIVDEYQKRVAQLLSDNPVPGKTPGSPGRAGSKPITTGSLSAGTAAKPAQPLPAGTGQIRDMTEENRPMAKIGVFYSGRCLAVSNQQGWFEISGEAMQGLSCDAKIEVSFCEVDRETGRAIGREIDRKYIVPCGQNNIFLDHQASVK